jgi:hypothetical protein
MVQPLDVKTYTYDVSLHPLRLLGNVDTVEM